MTAVSAAAAAGGARRHGTTHDGHNAT